MLGLKLNHVSIREALCRLADNDKQSEFRKKFQNANLHFSLETDA